MGSLRDRYLDLIVGAITHTLYSPPDVRPLPPDVQKQWQEAIQEEVERTGKPFVLPPAEQQREEGKDRPLYAHTMIGMHRTRNLRAATNGR